MRDVILIVYFELGDLIKIASQEIEKAYVYWNH
jgi:hypothetical protein